MNNQENHKSAHFGDNKQSYGAPVILVVDDSPENLRLLINVLKSAGYAVRVASNGASALRIAQTNPVDLVLLDIKMPEMDGLEVCRQLKARKATCEVPVIFVTGVHDTQDKIKGFSLGGVDYITKPFQVEEVLARVKLHMDLKYAKMSLEDRNARLAEQKELLRLFVEFAPAAIAMCDHNMRYLAYSKRWVKDYGLPDENLFGRCHYDVVPDMPDRWKQEHRKCLSGEIVDNSEEEFIRSDGRKDWVKRNIVPWRKKTGEIGGIIIFTEVITEQKQVEIDLRESKIAAEMSDRLKSQFLSNLSHEIRTPINAIFGFAELLQQETEDQAQRRYIESIRSSGKHLMVLIDDIVDLARIEAGNLEVSRSPVSIRELMHQINQLFSNRMRKKRLGFFTCVEEGIPELVLLDSIRIQQVLIKLLDNALKFTEKGHVKVNCSVSKRRIRQTKNHCQIQICFDIEDTGIGIRNDQKSLIFKNFQQVSGDSARKFAGIGLGLSIAKRLVEIMNGQIKVESKIGQGSIFRVTLFDVDVLSKSCLTPGMAEADPDALGMSADIETGNKAPANVHERLSLAETPSRIQHLIRILKDKFFPRWKDIKETLIFDEIMEFADDLIIHGGNENCPSVTRYGEALIQSVEAFDMEVLPDLFNRFPDVIKGLENGEIQKF